MILLKIAGLIALTFILVKLADLMIASLKNLSRGSSKQATFLSFFLLAFATSLPELFVTTTSSLSGDSSFSLGVVLGSNIANISVITGMAALIAGKVIIHGQFFSRDVKLAFLAGIASVILSLDGNLTRADGLILIILYFLYMTSFAGLKKKALSLHEGELFIHRITRGIKEINLSKTKHLALILGAAASMIFVSEMLLTLSSSLAGDLRMPTFLIGLIILALGTSLPELVFSIESIRGGMPRVFYGNLLGSVIVNSTLIVGLSALIQPVKNLAFDTFDFSVLYFIFIFVIFWMFIRSKMSLTRMEAMILAGLYIVFILVQVV